MAWGGFQVLPGAQDPFGSDVIAGHYRRNQCDIMITLCDVFMMEPAAMRGLNVVHWLPVDCRRMGKQDAEKARHASALIAMSRFGEEQMREAGFDPFYVPHGIDTQVFSPPEDKRALREELGFSPEHFLVGLNAANKAGPRKGLQEQIIAFAYFHEKHPDSRLLVHSFAQPREGLNVKNLADYYGIANAIMLPDQYAYACGLMDTPTMARWYGCLDVLLNCSYGEGFGLPVVEAQACGVPVIVTNASSMTELCGSGWKVSGEDFFVDGHDAMWTRPNVSGILSALNNARKLHDAGDKGTRVPGQGTVTWAQVQAKAREFALQYDADRVLDEYWTPVLKAIDDQRPKTRRVSAAQLDELPKASEGSTDGDLLLIVPSRGRPENVRRLIRAVAETAVMRTDIAFGFDDDDPEFEANLKAVSESLTGFRDRRVPSVIVTSGERMDLGPWTNKLALDHASGYRYLASFGDDHLPLTDGWDEMLIRVLEAGGPGFTYPNDHVREDIPQAVVVSSEIVQALGWMCEPRLEHFFVDNVWSDLGQFAGCITYCEDVHVEHLHHLNPKHPSVRDDTYRQAETKFTQDMGNFEQWRFERMKADVETVRKVREAAGC